jgi:hypothetical protein
MEEWLAIVFTSIGNYAPSLQQNARKSNFDDQSKKSCKNQPPQTIDVVVTPKSPLGDQLGVTQETINNPGASSPGRKA